MYVAEFEAVAVTAVQDLFELNPGAGVQVVLHAVYLSQSSDVGDAAEEILRVKIKRGAKTPGSGGSTSTPQPTKPGGADASTTVGTNNTTEASVGTIVDLHSDAFNIRTGWQYVAMPETRLETNKSAGLLTVTLMAAPIDELTMSGSVYWEEVG